MSPCWADLRWKIEGRDAQCKEDNEGEVRRLGLLGIWITLNWCLLGEGAKIPSRVFSVGCEDVFSPSLERGRVTAQQMVLYLQLIKGRGACRRMTNRVSLLRLMQSQASGLKTRFLRCSERV